MYVKVMIRILTISGIALLTYINIVRNGMTKSHVLDYFELV